MTIGQPERVTQDRIIALFRDELHYRYLGDWRDRDGNTNIEQSALTAYLTRAGYSPAQIAKATHALRTEADNQTRHPYATNEAVYKLLRYGVPVKIDVRHRRGSHAARPPRTPAGYRALR
jgi:type I restriction enzyme R subunit